MVRKMASNYILVEKDLDISEKKENPEEDEKPEQRLLGDTYRSEDIADRWLDTVEKMIEEESFEQGEKHSNRDFNRVKSDGNYFDQRPSRI